MYNSGVSLGALLGEGLGSQITSGGYIPHYEYGFPQKYEKSSIWDNFPTYTNYWSQLRAQMDIIKQLFNELNEKKEKMETQKHNGITFYFLGNEQKQVKEEEIFEFKATLEKVFNQFPETRHPFIISSYNYIRIEKGN